MGEDLWIKEVSESCDRIAYCDRFSTGCNHLKTISNRDSYHRNIKRALL